MSSENKGWKVMAFSAIAERDEGFTIVNLAGTRTFERRAGDALHPDRESLALYATIRHEIGEYNFQSQYQQNPSPPGGALVDPAWFRWYEPGEQPATFSRTVISLDSANKATELSNYSVFTVWGIYDKLYYLLDVVRLKLIFPDLERKALELASQFCGSTFLIEDRASGTQLIQTLQSRFVNGVTAYAPPPGADKVMRLHTQSSMFANGRVLLPRTAPWLTDYIQELTSFPGSLHSDQVDSTTQFLDYISRDSDLEIFARFAEADLSPFFGGRHYLG
jgi:predicted phage terminase large subunit-like protein